MNKQILVGQSHGSKIQTKSGENFLVVGLSAKDKLFCRSLDKPGDYKTVHSDDVEHVHTEAEKLPMVARVM